ncbi:MAG: hypothetical protein K6T30_09820, partial [Alicyclobacillus sp.]|nr:hypothetical protein [Alicyclobacillus sp.]
MSQTPHAKQRRKVPIEHYMEVRSAHSPAYSHDGERLFFLSNITGVPQVWVDEPGSRWPRQVTFFGDRVMAVAPSPASDVLVVNADQGGSENAQLYLTEPDGVELQDLSQDTAHIYSFGHWAPDGMRFSYTSNRRNGRAFDVYVYDVTSGTHTPVHTSDFSNYAGA